MVMRKDRLERRFWRRVPLAAGCWEWMGPRDRDGYGVASLHRKMVRAHRISWRIHNGPIPEGMCVCHHCDNPACVRPSHLFVGTQTDNMHDMLRKGRGRAPRKTHLSSLTWEDVREMRRLNREEGVGRHRLARMYGVGLGPTQRILNGSTWKENP